MSALPPITDVGQRIQVSSWLSVYEYAPLTTTARRWRTAPARFLPAGPDMSPIVDFAHTKAKLAEAEAEYDLICGKLSRFRIV
ncbi:MAG: hypothetical protein ABSA62_15170 [Methyloceanibacter sp.]|jgi:hypothetical protein